jgi:hypothetical protein
VTQQASGGSTVRIVHTLARSGGTLVCRCLGSMSGAVVLSKIHPMARHLMNPIAQAMESFGLHSAVDCARGMIGLPTRSS